MEGIKYHIKGLLDNNCSAIGCPQIYEIVKTECIIGSCPSIYGVKSTECMVGACPTIYNVTKEDCVGGGCPPIFEGLENKDVYLIVGKQIKPEEFEGLAGKVGVGEGVIAVPKSLVDKLSERK